MNGWVKPFCHSFVSSLGLIESLYLLMNDAKNGGGRLASLKLCGKRMRKEIAFCILFVHLKGIIKD
jgi:hypothetical protein